MKRSKVSMIPKVKEIKVNRGRDFKVSNEITKKLPSRINVDVEDLIHVLHPLTSILRRTIIGLYQKEL